MEQITVRGSHLVMIIFQTQKRSSRDLEILEYRSLHVVRDTGSIEAEFLVKSEKT